MNDDIIVISYRNENNKNSINLEKSLIKWGYKYKFIGLGEKWINNMTKIHSYFKELNSLNPNQIVCIMDCFDVIANGPPLEALNKFNLIVNSNSDKVVVSTEKMCTSSHNCLPLEKWWTYRKVPYEVRPRNQYLNSGFFMGRVHLVYNMLKECVDSGIKDDQLAMCYYAENNPSIVELDVQCKLMGTITKDVFEYECRGSRMQNTASKEFPCFIHTPGMIGDLHMRYNMVGRCVLKSRFREANFVEIAKVIGKKMPNSKITVFVVTIFIVILAIDPSLFPKMLIGLIIFSLLLYLLLKNI